ncbi:PREDICTED: coenzyme Q-binding protein COQ10 homolog, mitochondrial-like [Lupinus angustifolius]|uniref:coenzyme Q-binding protein COQ10 homolog, mitochondrial-like n=1 Tax=Lupinus angustifolius TaxID=3871 RepID=UPI00092F0B76|nr:PREDICTED: coenzyme Q-binding protein COQ10 homolog, mitochondrial-like [Lupinus angustifolius]XP_019414813.1 PREDICTED: coenzyme Q-binding protein COQ10 homolog, mitochondrial-like [Lupinus angustifolius]
MSPFLSSYRALLRSLESGKSGFIQSIKHSKSSGKVNRCQFLTTMASRTIHHHQIQPFDSRIRSSSSMGGFCNINNYSNYNNFVQTRKFLGCGDGEEGVLTRTYEEKRVLGYSPEQLFDVVAAVDFYHGFVPWCQRSEILKNHPDGSFDAELEIGFKFLVESYVSHVELERPKRIKTTVSQSNLFDHLINIWEFSPGPVPGTCNLYFLVDFKFQSPLYRQIASMFFKEVASRMVGSFSERCRLIYGPEVPVLEKSYGEM